MPLKSYISASLLTLGLLAATTASADPRLIVELTPAPGVDPQSLQSSLKPYGRLLSTDQGPLLLHIQNPDQLPQSLSKIQQTPGITKVDVRKPVLPQNGINDLPVTQLRALVDEYKISYQAYAKVKGLDPAKKPPGTGYLEAYLQYKELRAYPNEQIDWTGYLQIAQRRESERFENPVQRGNNAARVRFGGNGFNNLGNANGTDPEPQGSGQDWQYLGPTDLDVPYRVYYGVRPTSGRVNALTFDPLNNNVRYLGGAQGGVWKTTNAGQSWIPLTDDFPLISISSLAVHPVNTSIVLAGTGDFHGGNKPGIGIYRSADGGDTWTLATGNFGSHSVSEIKFYPGQSDLVFATAGSGNSGAVYRSLDAGQTWSVSLNQAARYSDLSIGAPDNNGDRAIYAVGYGTNRIYKSTDQGDTWTQITTTGLSANQGAVSVAASTVFPDVVYIMSSSNERIIKSTDGGTSWNDITNGFVTGGGYNWSQAWYDYHLHTSSAVINGQTQDLVFTGLIDVVMSDDGGQSWKSIGGNGFSPTYTNNAVLHNDQHSFAVNPQNPLHLMSGNDGGVYEGFYNPATGEVNWTPLNKFLGITQFYTFAMFPQMPDYVFGGTQDNASPHSHGNLEAWLNETGGDGAGCAINYNNFLNQYGSSQFHGLSRTDNAWQSSRSIRPNFNGHDVPFIGDMWMDPNDPRYVYVNTDYLCRYDAQTDDWEFLGQNGGPLTSGRVNAVAIAAGDSQTIYAGTTNGQIWLSTDFGANWTAIQSGGLPNRAVTSISIDPDDKFAVLATVSGSGGVYRCADVNAQNRVWTNVSGSGSAGLPAVSTNDLTRDPGDPANIWFAATDVGVFRTADAGNSWTDITVPRGLPNVQVNKIYANAHNQMVYAATYGRGMWRIPLAPGPLQSIIAIPDLVFENDNLVVKLDLKQTATEPLTFTLAASDPALSLPAQVTIPTGARSATVPATTGTVPSNLVVTITATDAEQNSLTTTVTIQDSRLVFPREVVVANGQITGGNVKLLQQSDDQYLSYAAQVSRQPVRTRFGALAKGVVPNKLTIDIEFKVSAVGTDYSIQLYDHARKQFAEVGRGLASTTDQLTRVNVTNGLAQYLDGQGNIQVLVQTRTGRFTASHTVSIDKLVLRFH